MPEMKMPSFRDMMPSMNLFEMPEMKMAEPRNMDEFMRFPEMKMPDPFGMMKEMNSHFQMMDELMGRLRDRDDWGGLGFRDWSTMTPHSERIFKRINIPLIEIPEPEPMEEVWPEDMESPVLLEQEFFLNEEEPGRHLHGHDRENFYGRRHSHGHDCTLPQIVCSVIFALWMALYCKLIYRFCDELRDLTNLKTVDSNTENMEGEERQNRKKQVANAKKPQAKKAITKQVENQAIYVPPTLVPDLDYQQVDAIVREPLSVSTTETVNTERSLLISEPVPVQVPVAQVQPQPQPQRQQATYTLEQVQQLLELERQRMRIMNQQ